MERQWVPFKRCANGEMTSRFLNLLADGGIEVTW